MMRAPLDLSGLPRLATPPSRDSVSVEALLGLLGLFLRAIETHVANPGTLGGDVERMLDDVGDAFPELLPFFRGEIGVGDLHQEIPIRAHAGRHDGDSDVGGDAEGDRLLPLILQVVCHARQHGAHFFGSALHGHPGRLTESRRHRNGGRP